jgi:tetratricopeptide (TPR) repeat protein
MCMKMQSEVALGLSTLLLAQSILCRPAFAGMDSVAKTFFENGKKLAKEKRFADAAVQLDMAEKNSQLKDGDSQKIELYRMLGNAYYQTGKFTNAEPYYQKVLEWREKDSKHDIDDLFEVLMYLGSIYRNQQRFKESEEMFQRGVKLYAGKGPKKALFHATFLAALANLYMDQDRPKEAEAAVRNALEVRNTTFLKAAFKLYLMYDVLGRALVLQSRYTEAESYLKQSLAEAEKDKNERQVSISKANLAFMYSNLDKYAEAKKLLDEVMVQVSKSAGSESSDAATIHSNMGQIALATDKYQEAEDHLLRAIEIHERNLGPDHASVAFDLGKIAQLYRNQGKYDLALTSILRAHRILEQSLGKYSNNNAQSLLTLGGIYADQGKTAEAEATMNEVVEIFEKLDMGNSSSVADALDTLAMVAASRKDWSRAEQLLQRATKILETNPNSEPNRVSRAQSNMASVYIRQHKYSEAESPLRKAIAVRTKIYGGDHARQLSDLMSLSEVYKQLKRNEEYQIVLAQIERVKAKNPELRTTTEAAPAVEVSRDVTPRAVHDKWALVIGVSNFKDTSINLKYASKDAVDFKNYLINQAKFAPDHVKLLTDKDATRENIVKQIGDAWLGRLANPDDLVTIYISSHASQSKDEAGGINFLVAHDTEPDALVSTGIPMQWLSQIIKEQVHSNRVVLILDVCHAGSVNAGSKGLVRVTPVDMPMGEGQMLLSSCKPDQVSWESTSYPNSVFTYKLLETLKANQQLDLTKAFDQLSEEVQSEVLRDRGKMQTPVLHSKAWVGPPPVLSTPPVKPRPGLK